MHSIYFQINAVKRSFGNRNRFEWLKLKLLDDILHNEIYKCSWEKEIVQTKRSLKYSNYPNVSLFLDPNVGTKGIT